nr:hypothetical protein [Tanacetum cinerariifolium]
MSKQPRTQDLTAKDLHGSYMPFTRRPKNSSVVWNKKGSSNTSNVGLSDVSVSNLNKNVKRYSRKDLLACNNSLLGETRSDFMCNDAMNVSCDSRMNDLLDDNNFFIFNDVNVRISPFCKMSLRKKPHDSMHVRSKSNSNKSLPRTVHKWLPKLQPLAEPVAKWFPRIVQIYLWIIDSGCSKHMTGNRALLTNFVEKFLGTVRFGNNDFAVIAGYGDVVIVPTLMVEQAKLKLDLVEKPVDHTDYRSMIGSLMYVTSSRPDIMFATYADHAGCHLDQKSTSGSVQFLGDKLVCWLSKKHNCVSISTAESEYVAVSICYAQVLWMRTQLTDYGFFYDKVPICCDSKSASAISCNPVQHTRTKHIDVRYHFIKDHVEKGTIELYFVGTEYQLADLFTKSLPEARFKF